MEELFNLPGKDAKSRGGYYTPKTIADFLSKWAITESVLEVLEPSAGDGEFVEAIAAILNGNGRITAVELDADEARKIHKRGGESVEVISGDFFAWYLQNDSIGSFDAVLGNPPFIRYQQFRESHRNPAFELMKMEGLHPTKLTNAWLPFVVAATRSLKQGGVLGMVLPAELLQVKYAAELRRYLASKYSSIIIVTFRKLVFPQIQQETILLLGIRGDGVAAEISVHELDSLEDLKVFVPEKDIAINDNLDHAHEKWTQYYLSQRELGLIREISSSSAFPSLGSIAQVDVGIVTGRNEFFVLTEDETRERRLMDWAVPLIGRSTQIKGIILKEDQWQQMVASGGKCFLIQLGSSDRGNLSQEALSYVEYGERNGFHEGYKCRVRLPNWWNVPSVWSPDAFMLRQIHEGPRVVCNPGNVVCTDTIHRVRMIGWNDASQLAATSMNSLTYAFAEIKGRSYGGGVLELEPTEAESIPFPTATRHLEIEFIDQLARKNSTEQMLDWVDSEVLKPSGLSDSEIGTLRNIWQKLSARRIHRKRR